jgi:carbon-monoxide dehydrogenase medium subunit
LIGKFKIHEPEYVRDVPPLLSMHGESGAIIAGGTELLLWMKQGAVRYEHLINIKRISGLDQIGFDEKEGCLRIGTLVTHRDLERADLVREKFPLIVEMEKQIGNIRIRHQGTVGGNLCIGDPTSDFGTLLLALGARVKTLGTGGERIVSLENFFVDFYETDLKKDEVLTEILLPVMPPAASGAYLRFRRGERPTLSVAAVLTFAPKDAGIRDAVITLGCVHRTPVRAMEAEEALRGKEIGEVLANLDGVGEAAVKPLDLTDDMHASAGYKRIRLQVMVKRAVQEAYQRKMSYSKE